MTSPVTSKTIYGNRVHFDVNTDGEFTAYVLNPPDNSLSFLAKADTLKACVRQARIELKKDQTRISVPFTHLDRSDGDNPLKPAIARGRHALRKQQILIWIDDGTDKGRNDTLNIYSFSRNAQVLKPDLPKGEVDRLKRLFEKKRKADEITNKFSGMISDWINQNSFNLPQAVDEAIKESEMPKGTQQLEDEK